MGALADNYSAAPGVVIRGGRFAPPPSVRTALMGDSLTDFHGYNLSPFQWINGLAGGPLQLVANAGVAGETVSQMLARVDNAYTNASPGMAGVGTLGHIFERSGTNDARASNTVSAYSATCASLLGKLHTYADKVYAMSLPYLGTGETGYATKNLLIDGYNAARANFAAANPTWCVFVDDTVNMRSGGAQLSQFFQVDTIHNNGYGTQQEGIDGYAALASRLAGYAYPIGAPDAALSEWFANPTFAGTSGSQGGTFTGSVVTGLSVGANGGGIAGACSIESADAGDANQTPWQVVTPSQVTTTGGGESIAIASTLSGRTITTTDPAVFEMLVEIDLRGLDTQYFNSMRLWVQGSGGVLTDDLALKMGGGPTTKKVMLRTRMPRQAIASTSATLYFYAMIAANFTGAMGNFRFRRISIRG